MWKYIYGKTYAQDYIEAYKISVFFENWQKIKSHDSTTLGYSVAPNQFMDLTAAEFKATMLTAVPLKEIPADV